MLRPIVLCGVWERRATVGTVYASVLEGWSQLTCRQLATLSYLVLTALNAPMCPKKASSPKHIAQRQPPPKLSRVAVKWKGLQMVQKTVAGEEGRNNKRLYFWRQLLAWVVVAALC